MKEMNLINYYTDGSVAKRLDKPTLFFGGWGFVCSSNNASSSGYEFDTTISRMELKAVVEALRHINSLPDKKKNNFAILSDSAYVVNGKNLFMKNWLNNGWMTTANKPIKNDDLWKELNELFGKSHVSLIHIAAHSDGSTVHGKFNNLADKIAVHAKNMAIIEFNKIGKANE